MKGGTVLVVKGLTKTPEEFATSVRQRGAEKQDSDAQKLAAKAEKEAKKEKLLEQKQKRKMELELKKRLELKEGKTWEFSEPEFITKNYCIFFI